MKEVTVNYLDDDLDLTITLKEANGHSGIRFSTLQTEASSEVSEGDGPAQRVEWNVKCWTYPTCMASTDKVTGKGSEKVNERMSLKDFLDLPWNLIRIWLEGSTEVNPAFSPLWRPRKKNENPEIGLTAS